MGMRRYQWFIGVLNYRMGRSTDFNVVISNIRTGRNLGSYVVSAVKITGTGMLYLGGLAVRRLSDMYSILGSPIFGGENAQIDLQARSRGLDPNDSKVRRRIFDEMYG